MPCGVEERASSYTTINTMDKTPIRRPWNSSSPIDDPRRTMKSNLPIEILGVGAFFSHLKLRSVL